ncbi:protocadherin Fat 2 [Eucyclogobius newberryi]|uniref:protocadherin Fat 2 n=1 Tax=Eucyclogobius newberryi TaxID=166745 RepID=UPI003B599898
MASLVSKLLTLALLLLLRLSMCRGNRLKGKDASPLRFTHHLYNTSIFENSAPRTYVETPIKMGIELTDLLWEIKFSIVSGDDGEVFQAEAAKVGDFAFLRIKTRVSYSASLNREVQDIFALTVEATESASDLKAKTKVIVQVLDTNDLKPLFYPASYYVAISEDSPLQSSVITVSATDADLGSNAKFYYSFTTRSHPFAVDPFTGTVSVFKKLNHTRNDKYDLTVFAEDRTKKISGQKFGNVAKVIVNVHKADKTHPVIASTLAVSSDGKVTVDVHVEPGIKAVESLNITEGDFHKFFDVIPLGVQGNDFQVISTKEIGWSQLPHGLNLSLQAKDSSFPSLLSPITKIHIPPVHYTPLTFLDDTYIVALSEFSPPKTHVVKVSAVPESYNVTYSIKANPDATKFKINRKTGAIVTEGYFDFETKRRYEFDVVADNGDAETHVVVEITDENDNAPQFVKNSYQATLDENSAVGSSVLKVAAVDKDLGKNGLVTYSIANTGPVPFAIDPFTGVISTSEKLDYELMKRQYHLRVWASDSGSPFSHVHECPVTITLHNVNDNVPLFERIDCNTTIPMDLAVEQTIVKLSAIDLDELQQLKYVIDSGNELGLFMTDSSGAIKLIKPIPPTSNAFNLRVIATDGKHQSDASVVRVTVTNRGEEPTFDCQETGILKQVTDKLIESIKPVLTSQEEDTFSDKYITNRHSPKLNLSIPGTIDLVEDYPLNSTIVRFKATDGDTGLNGKLVYAISSGNEDGCFVIDTFSGDLKLFCPLDREDREFYILNITVSDLGLPPKFAWKLIAVNVMDVNDNPPVFSQSRFVVRIPENIDVDSVIFTARAIDPDSETNGNVQYTLLTSADLFAIDKLTGEIVVTSRLDRETLPRHDLKIEARDQAKVGPQLFSTLDLVVVVQDINDNPPKFSPKVYKIKVPEDIPVGTLLTWLESVDLDLGNGGRVTYNLKNTENGIFHLDSTNGALTLERELDFERRPSYNLTVRAVDHGLPRSLSSSCHVEIEVLDVNENLHAPVFSEFAYTAAMPEDAPAGTVVVTVTASDKDVGRDGVVRYRINDGSGLGLFTVDEESGEIRSTEPVDRETTPHYWLSVYATDLGAEPLVSWCHVFIEVTDVNDNAPELSQPMYFGSVPENAAQVQSVVWVRAKDVDSSSQGRLTYELLEAHRTYFSVDPQTGVIGTHTALDREDKPEHSVEVMVSDNGVPPLRSTATVVIRVLDANDNRPKFTDKLFQVKLPAQERAAGKQRACRLVAHDDDEGQNAAVTYRLHGDVGDSFHIDAESGEVFVHGDFGPGNYSILTIKATDQGKSPRSNTARLDIQWISVPPPVSEPIAFEEPQFNFVIMETERVNHMVGIIPTDTQRECWFDIIGGDENKDFYIQRNTGTLSVARRLDAARKSNYNLTVRVTDGHDSATVQAYVRVVDINEHRPVFPKSLYEVRVPEDTSPWKHLLQIRAEDADRNSNLLYSIHSSLPRGSSGLFHLDPKSGMLVLTEKLDYEETSTHTLIVMVRDQEIPIKRNLVKVLVLVEDCNDHAPVFLSPRYEAALSNTVPLGSEVLRVAALDRDTGSHAHISYSLHSGNTNDVFSIDPSSGSITVSKPLDLQPLDRFHLAVKAADQGFPQRSDLCSVHVSVRTSENTPPVFQSDDFLAEIGEFSAVGTPVVAVSASSPAAVHYAIESGDANGTFHINPYTGLISTQKHVDFESRSAYELRVIASTSAGAVSRTVAHVYVVDENDNAPAFVKREYFGKISEGADANSLVMGDDNTPLVIQATDSDRDANSQLYFELLEEEASRVFKVDASTGTVSLISAVDFENKDKFEFTVQVRDSGEPLLYAPEPAKVTVRVLDLNDCPPRFTSPLYKASIIAPPVREAEVVRVAARDEDSTVVYSIADGNVNNAFSIDRNTGDILVDNVTDFKQFYQLVVRASDGLYKDSAIVKVTLANLTETDLRFERQVYAANVSENSETPKVLAALKVAGSDLSEPVVYTVINSMARFGISETSGVFESVGVPFDRETRAVYDVVVKVEDLRSPPRTATTLVKVHIDDVNDNAPDFLNLPYSATISDDVEPGDVLYQATAIDKDSGKNSSIVYSLEDHFELFRIDPNVGDISLQRPLDFDALNKYVLTIVASDEGKPSYSSTSQLTVQIRNRTNPIFQTLLYPLKVPENIQLFTTILHIQARNPEGYRLIYNLQEENASKHFHIDFKTGILTVTNPLDYESQTMHVLTVRTTDSVTGAYSEATIEVEVEDVNDNAPVFSKLSYSANIAEGLPIGTSVLHISATDKDSGRNKDLSFQLVKTEGNETDFFVIDKQSGLITTKEVLDYEDTTHFHLKVRVSDNGTSPQSRETLVLVNVTDVNDNPPDFVSSQYDTTLDEMAKCGHIVVKIQASDKDADDVNHLKYKILSGNEKRYFNINKTSGIISFSNVCKKNLDPYYNLTVAVSDGVFQNTAPVNIDMIHRNRHSPYFKQNIYEAELAENAEAGTRVIRLAAIDPDEGQYGAVDYTIINKLADEKFEIDKDGQIVTTQPLDRENPSQRVIAIKVMAKDGGGRVAFCTVRIILTDENDNVPQFKASEYQVAIQSTVNKGAPVIQIIAYDADDGKNADVTYTVDEATDVADDVIEINPFTGMVSVKESLAGMENKIFNFKVKARDGSLPFYNSTVPVQVTVVPPEVPLPTFSEPLYKFSAMENTPVGTEIGTVKVKADMPVIYSLVDGNTVESNKDKVFSLDEESGTLVVQKTIDHEKTKWYQIDVVAQGNHNGTEVASMVSVVIQVQDVNDNRPVFDASPYRAYLAENMPAGTTVIQVTANDPDTDSNGAVTYSLQPLPGDTGDAFAIDPDSGWITTTRPTDCEAARVYRLHVVATDNGGDAKLSSSVLVEVTVTDENDNPPEFTEDAYRGTIAENGEPGEVIVTMTTTDRDVSMENRLVTCYITDGDPLGQFAVVQVDEGQWGLIAKEALDRETTERFTLRITATDGRFQSPVSVELHVLDVNDNSPHCQQLLYTEAVMENSPINQFVLKVSASDPDLGPNGRVSFSLHGPDAHKFHLNHKTGELFTLSVLDRESEVEYNMAAKATDGGGRSCQADILLRVQDANDNAPVFSSSLYHVSVFDNTTARAPIAVLYAKDPDTGINSEVRYALVSGDDGFFSLDEFSGVLRLERPLTSEAPPSFQIKVKATDRGLPRQLSSLTTVAVDVVSLDDYRPVFSSAEYTARLPESFEVGSEVVSLASSGGDGGDPVVYRIVSGNEGERFHLDRDSGLLSLASALDYEACREYYLSVEGSRGRSTFTDITTVFVRVLDVNDNAPAFGKGEHSAEVSEDLSPGSLVMKVIATDADGPGNSLLRFFIVSGDSEQQFNIHPRTGDITVRTALDREQTPHYSLTVLAADEGSPPLSSALLVTVSVSDVNDNPPLFSSVTYDLTVQEGEAVGSGLLQLLVSDKDTPKNGPPFSFHIVSGNEDRRFQVDQGGLLSLSAPLRRRSRARHQLKVQVTDSGFPPLSSICVINVNVTETSRFAPSAVPLEVFITAGDAPSSNRAVGRIHASDRDPHDALIYSVASQNPPEPGFLVGPSDGTIWASDDLREGAYSLNVSVHDGRFQVFAEVRVHVWTARQSALDGGMTLRVAGVGPEEFIGDHWRGVQRALGVALGLDRQEIRLASLQQRPESKVLEVLLVLRPETEPAPALPLNKLQGIISDLEDSLGLTILSVTHAGCAGPGCAPRGCRSAVRLTGGSAAHYATARAGYITPQHAWESVCPCNESALRFDGAGHLAYLPRLEEERPDLRLSLRFRTLREQGVLAFANGTGDWGSLQLNNGELHFRYRCGPSPPRSLLVRSPPLYDGQWHHVSLEVNSTVLSLTLDDRPAVSAPIAHPCHVTSPHGAVLFANGAQLSLETTARLSGSFVGCLDAMSLNGEPIRADDGAEWEGPGLRRVFGVFQCCRSEAACAGLSCLNGGVCEERDNGGAVCRCSGQFHGPHCDLTQNPCVSRPCSDGRVCVPKEHGFICNCSHSQPHARCHNVIETCPPDSCPRDYGCKVVLGSIHCDPMPVSQPMVGFMELVEIGASVLGVVFLVAIFVCVRKRYVQLQKKKAACVQDSNGYFPSGQCKSLKSGPSEMTPMEMTAMDQDQDTSPFRSLRPRSQLGPSVTAGPLSKPQGPVVCSVAPHLPARPPSTSDTESIRKSRWDQDYEVYPADPDYYGRPTVQEFPTFDITSSSPSPHSTLDSRRNSRFGGFPFPLERPDRRAPLPPCYSNQNLDDFLGPDGLPLPTGQCPNEYTAISYYPAKRRTHSLDNVSPGYKRLSMRLSVAMPSYAETPEVVPLSTASKPAPRTRSQAAGQTQRAFDGGSTVGSDYGSCEEVMF